MKLIRHGKIIATNCTFINRLSLLTFNYNEFIKFFPLLLADENERRGEMTTISKKKRESSISHPAEAILKFDLVF